MKTRFTRRLLTALVVFIIGCGETQVSSCQMKSCKDMCAPRQVHACTATQCSCKD